jgi:hypothetical protein
MIILRKKKVKRQAWILYPSRPLGWLLIVITILVYCRVDLLASLGAPPEEVGDGLMFFLLTRVGCDIRVVSRGTKQQS